MPAHALAQPAPSPENESDDGREEGDAPTTAAPETAAPDTAAPDDGPASTADANGKSGAVEQPPTEQPPTEPTVVDDTEEPTTEVPASSTPPPVTDEAPDDALGTAKTSTVDPATSAPTQSATTEKKASMTPLPPPASQDEQVDDDTPPPPIEADDGGLLQSSLFSTSVGLAAGLAAPLALAGITAVLVVGSIVSNPQDPAPQTALGLFAVGFQILRFPACIAGPLGLCGATAGAVSHALFAEDASYLPATVGAGVGVVTLGISFVATIFGFLTYTEIPGDRLLLTGLVTVPLSLYVLSGALTLGSVVATDFALEAMEDSQQPATATAELPAPRRAISASLVPLRY